MINSNANGSRTEKWTKLWIFSLLSLNYGEKKSTELARRFVSVIIHICGAAVIFANTINCSRLWLLHFFSSVSSTPTTTRYWNIEWNIWCCRRTAFSVCHTWNHIQVSKCVAKNFSFLDYNQNTIFFIILFHFFSHLFDGILKIQIVVKWNFAWLTMRVRLRKNIYRKIKRNRNMPRATTT